MARDLYFFRGVICVCVLYFSLCSTDIISCLGLVVGLFLMLFIALECRCMVHLFTDELRLVSVFS